MGGTTHHGQVLLHREVAGFRLHDARYPSLLSLPKHFHDHAALYFVRSGNFEETQGSRVLAINQGCLWFRPAGELHRNRFGTQGARCLLVEPPDHWLQRAGQTPLLVNEPQCHTDNEISWLGRRLCREWRLWDASAPLIIEGLLLELAGCLSRLGNHESSAKCDSQWIRRAAEILHASYRQDIHLSVLAALIGVHPVHLAREFRKYYRCTVGEYVRRLRVQFACKELARTRMPISAIALEAGFANQAHFTRTFRLVTGTTPAQYRAGASDVNPGQKLRS